MSTVRLLQLAHLLISLQVRMTSARGVPIDIFNQDGSDMALPHEDNFNALEGFTGIMYNAIPSTSNSKWRLQAGNDYIIPYTITGQYEPNELEMLKKVMEHVHDTTCIRFKQRKDEKDYVEIQNNFKGGCYSPVGRHSGKRVMNLEANYAATCFTPRILLHELFHVIGLFHEHMRFDRDNYVTVHYDNVERRYWSQFQKLTLWQATTYNIPYDYKSIMHYSKTSFAKPGTISMETKDPRYQLSTAKAATPSDYLKVCKIYECKRCLGDSTGNSDQDLDWLLTGSSLPSTSGAVFVIVIGMFHFWN
ncbi:unnamed protein product [Cylicocyclus nassatus]|uniref:Metalloendopeptidase n=1 Tax=Cylicocyclus nassatus TaxID=53992 RepID=A0AA36M2F3_CYLNA|nr:unnamed protein product [Cylicocyclus nassatus]